MSETPTPAAPPRRKKSGDPGPAVDAFGAPAIDPTENVIALSEAGNRRQDDLRDLTKELFEAKIHHLKELGVMATRHQRELDHAESERLDSIRQVDREDVNKTAAQALNAIQTLAVTASTTAETLRTQVATTALAAQNQLATITGEINKRLSALELSLSEGKGKQAVVDPQLEQMLGELRALRMAQASGTGKVEGVSTTWAFIVAAIGASAGITGIVTLLMRG